MTSHHAVKTALGLALTFGAIAPTAASAHFDLNRPTRPTSPPPQPAVQVVRVSAPAGFDWSSAGIGAAGGFGLSILALGGGLLIAERNQHMRPRAHRPRPPTERPSRQRRVASRPPRAPRPDCHTGPPMKLDPDRHTHRRAPTAALVLVTIAVFAAGCGTLRSLPAGSVQAAKPLPWPSAADYGTIKTAVAVRDQALFHEKDWRRKAFAAMLAARTLLTVRIAPGLCATYVTQLYGNLRDLMDAYPGENWRPLIRLVHHQPPPADACHNPERQLTQGRDSA